MYKYDIICVIQFLSPWLNVADLCAVIAVGIYLKYGKLEEDETIMKSRNICLTKTLVRVAELKLIRDTTGKIQSKVSGSFSRKSLSLISKFSVKDTL